MSNRRDFLKTTAAVGGIAVGGNLAVGAFAAGNETIKVGLIGCGGRGRGAVRDILEAESRINGANPKVEIVGILPTMYDRRLTHSREADEILRENFGALVYNTRIRKTIRFAEAPVKGTSVLAYDPKGEAAELYLEEMSLSNNSNDNG